MPDLLVLSLGTTRGLRVADAIFADLARRAGASVALVATRIGATDRLRRGYPVNDVVEAVAARRAAATAIARERPRAVVFSTTTAALLAPPLEVPYAIRFDAPAALNRPGRRNAPLHRLERRRMAQARLLLPTSTVARDAVPPGAAPSVVIPIPVVASAAAGAAPGAAGASRPAGAATPTDDAATRDRVAVAYVPDPRAKGLDLLCAAWEAAAVPDARLDVYGIAPDSARAHLLRCGVPEPPAVAWRGMVPGETFRRALREGLAYVNAARWEDYGQAQLEALVDGALLVTAPSDGPFEGLALARRLTPELVADDMSPAALADRLRRAFALDPATVARHRAAAADALAAYAPDRVVSQLADEVLPALLDR